MWTTHGRRLAQASVNSLLELCFPLCCAACGEALDGVGDGVLCTACRTGWVALPHPRCGRCGHPTGGRPCRWCERLPPYVRAVRSVVWYPDGSVRRVLAAFKYAGWQRVADPLARAMAPLPWPDDVVDERAAYVPVPLSPRRLAARGFNQSQRLADALARHRPLPVWGDVLVRVRATGTQTRLTPLERSRNVSAAFGVPAGGRSRLRGRHIVLVDDVITTAATLNACAAALVEGGARVVSGLSFGRARAPGDEPAVESPRR